MGTIVLRSWPRWRLAEFRIDVSFFGRNRFDADDWEWAVLELSTAPFMRRGKECTMAYYITLRSRTDARITGWYDGSHSRWSTDRNRQKVFDERRDARPVCDELRSLCPRNAEVINIEAEQVERQRKT
jgi:hypothetical protein